MSGAVAAGVEHPPLDLGHGRGGLVDVDGDPDQLGARLRELDALLRGRRGVGGVGVGHRLDDDRRAAADLDTADRDADGLPAAEGHGRHRRRGRMGRTGRGTRCRSDTQSGYQPTVLSVLGRWQSGDRSDRFADLLSYRLALAFVQRRAGADLRRRLRHLFAGSGHLVAGIGEERFGARQPVERAAAGDPGGGSRARRAEASSTGPRSSWWSS